MGHGPRGHLRRRRRLELLPPRPRPLAGLPLGRGRPARASATTAQRLCFGLALWNEADPIIKERLFGLTNAEGNHGEDVKEYYFYLDATPTHSWLRALYKYPQAAFPYERPAGTNAARGKHDPEYELVDTGVFDDQRYFDVEVVYAKAGPEDCWSRSPPPTAVPTRRALHLLPTLWLRNTWGNDAAARPVRG